MTTYESIDTARRTVKYDGDDPEAFYSIFLRAFDGWWAKVTVQTGPTQRQTVEGYITRDGNCVVVEPDDETPAIRLRLISVVRITLT